MEIKDNYLVVNFHIKDPAANVAETIKLSNPTYYNSFETLLEIVR